MYDPAIGRFLTEDPIGFSGDPSNLYRYVKNNPLTYTDPSGLADVSVTDNLGPIQNFNKNGFDVKWGIDASRDYRFDTKDFPWAKLANARDFADPGYIGAFLSITDPDKGKPCGEGGRGNRVWASAKYAVQAERIRGNGTRQNELDPVNEPQGKWVRDKQSYPSTDMPFFDLAGMSSSRGLDFTRDPNLKYIQRYGYAVAAMCSNDNGRTISGKPLFELFYTVRIEITKDHVTLSVGMNARYGGLEDWTMLPNPR